MLLKIILIKLNYFNIKKMWIECSEFNYKLLLPLIYPLFGQLENPLRLSLIKKDTYLFKSFRYFLSHCFSFIPFIITKIRSKNNNNKEEEESALLKQNNSIISNELSKIVKQIERKKNIKNILFLLGICCVGFIAYYHPAFFDTTQLEYTRKSLYVLFTDLVYIILSRIILKQKLFIHSYLSAGIIAFNYIILFIITISYVEPRVILDSFGYYILNALIFGFYDVIKKKYMIMFCETPYFFMFSVGGIISLSLLFYDIIAYFANQDASGIIIGFKDNINSVGDFFLLLLDLILEWGWICGIWLTIFYLSPCHYFISGLISDFINYLKTAHESSSEFYCTRNMIIFTVAIFLNFFWCLIFNEVIIINLWGLDYNTRKRIQERERTISNEDINAYIELEKKKTLSDKEGETDESISYNI